MKIDISHLICKAGARITQRLGVGIPFSIKINKVNIFLRTFSIIEWLLWIRGWNNLWELPTRNFFVKNIDNYDVFLDIGANTGIYSILAAGLSKKIKVIAIEPVFSNCIAISKIREINKLNNLYILNVGLSSEMRLGEFFTPHNQHFPCSGTLSAPIYEKASKLNQFVTFPGDLFESIFSKQKVLVKIDVEGHEESVLKGLRGVFDSNHCALIIELLPESHNLYQFFLHFFRERSMSPFHMLKDGNVTPMEESFPDISTSDGINLALNILFLPP